MNKEHIDKEDVESIKEEGENHEKENIDNRKVSISFEASLEGIPRNTEKRESVSSIIKRKMSHHSGNTKSKIPKLKRNDGKNKDESVSINTKKKSLIPKLNHKTKI